MKQNNKPFIDRFVKEHEYLTFDSASKTVEPKLTYKVQKSVFEYLSPNGDLSSAVFKPSTNEYKILTFLMKHRTPVDTAELIGELNDPRDKAIGADNKQRARDKIKAITKKLGKGLIEKTKDGYVITCRVDSV